MEISYRGRPRFSSQRQATSSTGSGPAYKGLSASLIVVIATAAIGYVVTFLDEHKKAQTRKIDLQIEKLYGPLYAYSVASRRAWDDLHAKYRPELKAEPTAVYNWLKLYLSPGTRPIRPRLAIQGDAQCFC